MSKTEPPDETPTNPPAPRAGRGGDGNCPVLAARAEGTGRGRQALYGLGQSSHEELHAPGRKGMQGAEGERSRCRALLAPRIHAASIEMPSHMEPLGFGDSIGGFPHSTR